MKKVLSLLVVIAFVGLPAFAQKDENNRIKNSGKVMTEILNVPDDIPKDLLDKARPSARTTMATKGCMGKAPQRKIS